LTCVLRRLQNPAAMMQNVASLTGVSLMVIGPSASACLEKETRLRVPSSLRAVLHCYKPPFVQYVMHCDIGVEYFDSRPYRVCGM
jgi:hypothetical protein